MAIADINQDSQPDVVTFGAAGGRLFQFKPIREPILKDAFEQAEIVVSEMAELTAATAGDVDGDGDLDIVFGDGTQTLYWQSNMGGGVFAAPVLIVESIVIGAVTLVDLDGDHDLDLYYAEANESTASYYWRENLDHGLQFSSARRVGDSARVGSGGEGIAFAIAEDFDNDNDIDLLAGDAWIENQGGVFTQRHPFEVVPRGAPLEVAAGDIDLDGDIDLVMQFSSVRVIYENENGTFQVIYRSVREGGATALTDLDGDGFPELLWGLSAHYPNDDGVLTAAPVPFSMPEIEVEYLALADFDGDGIDEYVFGNRRSRQNASLAFAKNQNGELTIQTIDDDVGSGDIISLEFTDLDGDGQLDILLATSIEGGLSWYQNLGDGWSSQMPLLERHFVAIRVGFVDIDGDGDIDLVGRNSSGDFGWYPNTGGQNGDRVFSDGQWIGRNADELFVWDIDGDGDQDVVARDRQGDESVFSWFPNLDGVQQFGDPIPLQVPDSLKDYDANNLTSAAVDVDGDGDQDFVVGQYYRGSVRTRWIENRGINEPLVDHPISREFCSICFLQVRPVDVDGDQDLDLIVAYSAGEDHRQYDLSWYENTDGRGLFADKVQISTTASVFSYVDFDGDGDGDVVGWSTTGVIYYEHLDGAGQFSTGDTLFADHVNKMLDIDGDGDQDFLSLGPDAWFENLGNGQDFYRHEIDDSMFGDASFDMAVADFNDDGSADVVTYTRQYLFTHNTPFTRIRLHRNILAATTITDINGDGETDALDVDRLCRAVERGETDATFDVDRNRSVDRLDVELLLAELGSVFADVNLDGQFDSSDLVEMLSLGLYESGPSDDVRWSAGDWNCDGVVDSGDLVAALQRGHYRA